MYSEIHYSYIILAIHNYYNGIHNFELWQESVNSETLVALLVPITGPIDSVVDRHSFTG